MQRGGWMRWTRSRIRTDSTAATGTVRSNCLRDMAERGDLSPEEGSGLLVSAVKHFLHPGQQPESAIEWVAEHTPPEFVESNLARARALRDANAAARQNR